MQMAGAASSLLASSAADRSASEAAILCANTGILILPVLVNSKGFCLQACAHMQVFAASICACARVGRCLCENSRVHLLRSAKQGGDSASGRGSNRRHGHGGLYASRYPPFGSGALRDLLAHFNLRSRVHACVILCLQLSAINACRNKSEASCGACQDTDAGHARRLRCPTPNLTRNIIRSILCRARARVSEFCGRLLPLPLPLLPSLRNNLPEVMLRTYIPPCIHTSIRAHSRTHTPTHARTHTHKHIQIHIHIHTKTHGHAHVRANVLALAYPDLTCVRRERRRDQGACAQIYARRCSRRWP